MSKEPKASAPSKLDPYYSTFKFLFHLFVVLPLTVIVIAYTVKQIVREFKTDAIVVEGFNVNGSFTLRRLLQI
jgi:hypothetical protein